MKRVVEGAQPGIYSCNKCGKHNLHESETAYRYDDTSDNDEGI